MGDETRPDFESIRAGDPYTCANCGGTFETGWDAADAAAEAEENFGDALGDDPAVICDDCYQKMVAWKSPSAWVAEQGCPRYSSERA